MEFKYRAVDERPPSSSPPPCRHQTTSSSGYSCFSQQATEAGYRIPSSGRANEYFNLGPGRANDCFNAGFGQENEYTRIPLDVREAIQRELEKERIREEIIAAEIARRQALEAEVRREMMIERELALLARRGQVDAFDRFLFPLGGLMEFEPRDVSFLHDKGLSLEERIAMSIEERLGMRERRETGRVEVVPFHHESIEPKIKEAIPDASLSGAKQKAVLPEEEGASDLSGGASKKKVKEEWSCALCRVSAANERGLNDHIQGKKHRSKVAALRAQRNGNNIGIGTFPKKDIKPSVKITQKIISETGLKPRRELSQFSETRESSLQVNSSAERIKENNVPILEGSDKTKNTRKENLELQKAPKKKQKENKIYTFWCEMCQVGAYNENAMEAHRKGKKHMARLQEAKENGTTNLTPQDVGFQAVNDADEATIEGDNINNENADGAKPDASLSGAEQKAVPPEEEGASCLSGGVSKKKVEEEWSCALCQVSAASERGLNAHIQGKKHNSKAAALWAQMNGNNIGIDTFSRKDISPSVEITHNISSEMELKPMGDFSQFNQTGEFSLQINSSTERIKENNVSILEESDKTDNRRKENLGVQKAPKKDQKVKKTYTFWCEMCRVGAYDENVMEAHRKGKKHMARLQEAEENGTTNLTPQIVGFQAVNDADEATLEGHNINNENADGAKPDASLSGAEQKAVPPEEEGGSDLSGGVSKKKVNEEWSCALCQVSAASERGLNAHIQGKKHKSKAAALRAQMNGNNIGTGTFSRKDICPSVEITHNISSEMGPKPRGDFSQFNHTREFSLQINSSTERIKENDVSILEESDKTDNTRKENLGVQKAPKKEQKVKKTYTFWCEMCQVGAYDENVMEAHRKGQKHMARLQEAEENGTTNLTPQIVGFQAVNDADEATIEGDKINNENADGAKPDASLSGAEQKAVPPEEDGASDLSGGVSKKKVKEGWSCALCQVTATSERDLNDHIQGKKHKSKEAALRPQRNVAS